MIIPHEYISKPRIISYYNQCRLIKVLGKEVKSILEIGIYNSLFTSMMTREGYELTTADVDPQLNADIVLNLAEEFEIPRERFDAIALFQVLEHIPYEAFEKALVRLAEFTKKFVIISLPYYSDFFTVRLEFSFLPRARHLFLQIPHFWSTKPLTDEHYWEIGLKGYPKERIIKSIQAAGLILRRQYQDPLNPYHYFFVAEKKAVPAKVLL